MVFLKLIKHKQVSLLWLGMLLLLTASLIIFWLFWDDDHEASGQTVDIGRISFVLQVHERGVVRPARVMPVKSSIFSNQAKLVWLSDEGKAVNRGGIIARFDTKPFMDAMEKAEQALGDAKAQLTSAEKSFQLQKEENASKLEAAKRELEIANIKANDLQHGTGELMRRQLLQELHQTGRDHVIAQAELTDFEALLAKGHVSLRERDKAANRLQTASEKLELAKTKLDNYERFEMPRLLREAELMVDAALKDVGRVQRTAELELKRRRGAVIKLQRDVRSTEKQLARAMENLKNCDVRAPIDGTLLYVKLPFTEVRRKAQVGDAIWLGQTFMEIPDTRKMVVEIDVREVDVAKLKEGMKATVELDAFPGRRFHAMLQSIESLAHMDDNNRYLHRYRAIIRLLEAVPEIHVGMSVDVVLTYKKLNRVLAVPVSAIVYSAGSVSVWIKKSNNIERAPITLGEIGYKWAEVISGLEEGDQIVVNQL